LELPTGVGDRTGHTLIFLKSANQIFNVSYCSTYTRIIQPSPVFIKDHQSQNPHPFQGFLDGWMVQLPQFLEDPQDKEPSSAGEARKAQL